MNEDTEDPEEKSVELQVALKETVDKLRNSGYQNLTIMWLYEQSEEAHAYGKIGKVADLLLLCSITKRDLLE
jgi:hypothetical protein